MSAFLSIDIGGTKTSVAVVEKAEVQHQHTWASAATADDALALVTEQVRLVLDRCQVAACGIGFGGQFDFQQQTAIRSVHVPGWEGFPLSAWAAEHFGLLTITDNDANVGGIGEARFGAGRMRFQVVYLTISTGIGGAIVLEGQVRRGSHSLAAEFGHVTVDPDGPECGCGLRGCAERLLSGLWLERDHGIPAQELFRDGAFLADYAERLAFLLRQVTMVVDPDGFVLGGGIGASSGPLAEATQAALAAQLQPWQREAPQVRMAELGGNSVLIGAAQMAKERYGSP